jgi:hypothetical protein
LSGFDKRFGNLCASPKFFSSPSKLAAPTCWRHPIAVLEVEIQKEFALLTAFVQARQIPQETRGIGEPALRGC